MPRTAAVVLAAGASRRFGANKLLAHLGGVPLIRRTVQNVLDSRVWPVHVVLGRDAGRVRVALAGLPVGFVHNVEYEAGMSTSLRTGIAAARAGGAGGLLVVLGDEPGVTPGVIDRIVETYRRTRRAIVVPVYRGTRGHPVHFDAAVLPELLEVRGDRGGREVIEREPSRVAVVAFDDPSPRDVDTPDELATVQRELDRVAIGTAGATVMES